jgi:hypothetical protein
MVFEYPSHELVIDRGVLKELSLRADLIPEDRDVRRISREFADCASETLIMLVDPLAYPHGTPVPEPSEEFTLNDWRLTGSDEPAHETEPARDIVWTHKEGTHESTFVMRVGLYRSTVKRMNRWDESTTRTVDGAPATQYGVVSKD